MWLLRNVQLAKLAGDVGYFGEVSAGDPVHERLRGIGLDSALPAD
jgi:hypothetical protein